MAGRQSPEEAASPEVDGTDGNTGAPARPALRQRQRRLFEFGMVANAAAPSHELGLAKRAADFVHHPKHSVPWGDTHASGEEIQVGR